MAHMFPVDVAERGGLFQFHVGSLDAPWAKSKLGHSMVREPI